MPELPDITVYVESLAPRIVGSRLKRARLQSPFVLRTAVPPIAFAEGKAVVGVRRMGKRIVIGFEGELFLVIHLMVAGRFRWMEAGNPASLLRNHRGAPNNGNSPPHSGFLRIVNFAHSGCATVRSRAIPPCLF